MNEAPIFRPSDRVTDPELFQIARARWPGHAITSEMLTDAARLEGRPLYVPATREAVAAGMAEIAKDRRATVARNEIARSYKKMNFDPNADYHAKG